MNIVHYNISAERWNLLSWNVFLAFDNATSHWNDPIGAIQHRRVHSNPQHHILRRKARTFPIEVLNKGDLKHWLLT